MRQFELERKREIKAKEIEESGLIERCKELALTGRVLREKVRDSSTHMKTENFCGKGERTHVTHEHGIYSMGDGKILTVHYNKNLVFKAVDQSSYNTSNKGFGTHVIKINARSKSMIYGKILTIL